MTPIAALPPIAFIFTDTPVCTNACILAALAGSLTVTALLALAATLTARLTRQVFLVNTKLVLEVE